MAHEIQSDHEEEDDTLVPKPTPKPKPNEVQSDHEEKPHGVGEQSDDTYAPTHTANPKLVETRAPDEEKPPGVNEDEIHIDLLRIEPEGGNTSLENFLIRYTKWKKDVLPALFIYGFYFSIVGLVCLSIFATIETELKGRGDLGLLLLYWTVLMMWSFFVFICTESFWTKSMTIAKLRDKFSTKPSTNVIFFAEFFNCIAALIGARLFVYCTRTFNQFNPYVLINAYVVAGFADRLIGKSYALGLSDLFFSAAVPRLVEELNNKKKANPIIGLALAIICMMLFKFMDALDRIVEQKSAAP